MSEKKEGIHQCFYAYGKIKDVSLRNKTEIHCRRCGDRLKEDEVNQKCLN